MKVFLTIHHKMSDIKVTMQNGWSAVLWSEETEHGTQRYRTVVHNYHTVFGLTALNIAPQERNQLLLL